MLSSYRNKPLDNVNEISYLGDLVNGKGENMSNIKNRVTRGKSIISEIFNILENICYGPHFFEIALLLRRTMLISSVTYNCSVWYNLNAKDINELNKIDQIFFSRLCQTPYTATFISYFLEFGVLEIEMHIKAERVLYFFRLVNRCKKQAIYCFFMIQYHKRNEKDWVTQTLKDFEDLNIDSSFEFCENISINSFPKIVKREI